MIDKRDKFRERGKLNLMRLPVEAMMAHQLFSTEARVCCWELVPSRRPEIGPENDCLKE